VLGGSSRELDRNICRFARFFDKMSVTEPAFLKIPDDVPSQIP
jgi:hypothetical protein